MHAIQSPRHQRTRGAGDDVGLGRGRGAALSARLDAAGVQGVGCESGDRRVHDAGDDGNDTCKEAGGGLVSIVESRVCTTVSSSPLLISTNARLAGAVAVDSVALGTQATI